jgi:abortive infection bacteriophage resistance protein
VPLFASYGRVTNTSPAVAYSLSRRQANKGWFSFWRTRGCFRGQNFDVKPHLNYEAQLQKLIQRGLIVEDRPLAISVLKRVGYYRFSGYTYSLRAAPSAADIQRGRTRSSTFRANSTFEQAVKLYNFDTRLRHVVLAALQEIEVTLAAKIGYHLGKRDPQGHLNPAFLDARRASVPNNVGVTTHQSWVSRYDGLVKNAHREDYVAHHLNNYDGQIPVWVATGVMDFGCLTRLYALLAIQDRRKIAAEFGLDPRADQVLAKWLRALNVLRNNCAHNNRIWNKPPTFAPPKPIEALIPTHLHHLADLSDEKWRKIYPLLAIAAHLVTASRPDSDWATSTLPTQLGKLGNVAGMTLESTMGFPEGWRTLPLWQRTPPPSSGGL